MSRETIRLIRDGEKEGGGGKGEWGGGREMSSGESHFNVSVGSDGQSHNAVSTNHNFWKRKESRGGIEPRSFRLPAYSAIYNTLPLGQTTHDKQKGPQ